MKDHKTPPLSIHLCGHVTIGTKDGAVFKGEIPHNGDTIIFMHGRQLTPTGASMYLSGTLRVPADQVAWVFNHHP